jgi:RNA polymerase sigma-70 factor (ECF subfamily)
MSSNITAIFESMADGNMGALGELYRTFSVRVFNYAQAITRNKEMAEDITHDVFLRIYSQASRLAKMENPVAYIMTATRNESFSHIKRSNRVTATLEDVSEISDTSATYDQLFIEEAFSCLPPNQRETVYLHHVCGFTYKEVSQIMGAPLVTVKWRCGKAMQQLRAYFNQEKEDNCDGVTGHNYKKIAEKHAN